MLQLKNISKQYKTGDLVQIALNNVSLNFRDNEFVSILGPSGSGKTTLLNIIGGLDHYDKGDLIINNISTKKYKDRDWDSYRNHTIGFVFQNYNLIPHQTVLSNVELALTISGISRKNRKKRALEALEKVGLKDQAHKRPNQMSGGQMQRVAIARALVNNPDIVLADEPTGALDSTTSIQVMELLKEVAKDRLVIMVTHNPELAQKYSTRIVNLKDGVIQGDTNPYELEYTFKEEAKHKNMGKSSMSRFTALSLSLTNLLTKKGRTFLTAFAGSIGIIGIALILSLSTGFQNYVDKIQEDTLTSYPLTIQSETADLASALLSVTSVNSSNEEIPENTVKEQQNIANLFGSIGSNDLKSFKSYLEDNKDKVDEMVSLTKYSYSVTPTIYTKDVNNELMVVNPSNLTSSLMGSSNSLMSSSMSIFSEMSESKDMVEEEYDIIDGKLPEAYNEIVLVLPTENTISDMLLYTLGLRDSNELENIISSTLTGEKFENSQSPLTFTYKELENIELKLVDPSSIYKYNEDYNIYEDMSKDAAFMENVYNNATKLNIVGIVKPKNNLSMTGVLYTRDLTEYVINKAKESELVQKQLQNMNINVFSGKDFDEDDESTGIDFQDLVTIDTDAISSAFNVNINQDDISEMTQGYMSEISSAITADTSVAQTEFLNNLSTITKNILNDYIYKNQIGGFATIKLSQVDDLVNNGLSEAKNQSILKDMETKYVIPADTFSQMYNGIITGFLKQYITMMSGATGTLPSIPGSTTQEEPTTSENIITNNEISGNIENTINNFESGNVVNNSSSNTVENVIVDDNSDDNNMETEKPTDPSAILVSNLVDQMVDTLINQDGIVSGTNEIAIAMTEANMQKTILTKVGELTGKLMETMASSFNIDTDKFAGAFKFEMNEDEIRRLMETMSSTSAVENANTNLLSLGYQDLDEPTSIYFYFKDFDSKEKFISFLDEYNARMEKEDENKVIKYSDLTGLLMSSVKTIIDSVSYVLIAFVSISLVVSSIMIGIITYISVLERTKEIGILRAIGASKKNISSIFNSETFIIGLFSGLLGIGITLLLLIPINLIIHSINTDITAVLPFTGGIILVILSVILTLIGGLIPSKAAAKKDPVTALRTE